MTEKEQAIAASRLARRTATIQAIKKTRTQVDFWSQDLLRSANESWERRAASAATFIPPGSRVLDIGCGDMKMERNLPEGCSYLPMDVSARDERTIVVDLNRQRLPKVAADFVVALGLLEYIFDVPKLLRQIARQIPQGLFSYHPLEKTPGRDRLAMNWVNALNSPEIIALFKQAGYRQITVHEYAPTLHFYHVSTQRAQRADPSDAG